MRTWVRLLVGLSGLAVAAAALLLRILVDVAQSGRNWEPGFGWSLAAWLGLAGVGVAISIVIGRPRSLWRSRKRWPFLLPVLLAVAALVLTLVCGPPIQRRRL